MSLYLFAENIIVHELLHLAVAVLVSFVVYKKYRSNKLVVAVFLSSFLIDIDHLTEGFILFGPNIFNWYKLIRGGFFRESGYMTIFLHSWELLPIILLASKKLRVWPLGVTIVVSIVGHLLVDQLIYTGLYGMSLLQYSFFYRALNHFSFYKLCVGCI